MNRCFKCNSKESQSTVCPIQTDVNLRWPKLVWNCKCGHHYFLTIHQTNVLPEKDPVLNRKASVIPDYERSHGQWPHCYKQKERIQNRQKDSRLRDRWKDLVAGLSLLHNHFLQPLSGGSEALATIIYQSSHEEGKSFPLSVSFHLDFQTLNHCPIASLDTWVSVNDEWMNWGVSLTDKWENTAVMVLTNRATFTLENERLL